MFTNLVKLMPFSISINWLKAVTDVTSTLLAIVGSVVKAGVAVPWTTAASRLVKLSCWEEKKKVFCWVEFFMAWKYDNPVFNVVFWKTLLA